ncbi:UDP-N-acetylmuramate dehydrogenase [Maribellus comscasis]|uniref:UDP-N-acetylenolpyruvoylglucosamine reductase n=1 Tax=Maribellus comscasis TaxID=2681766 RepID=A0A6I6JS87_9BACT|nr:UDP-N-acetylmuramate dehydrogenase [Maribellus comscasis]QGY42987.1 UDP-N-acetylmuramate dehydrogenase [Maribellus comscasis]
MIRFFENYSLQPFNTFNIEAKAKYFFEFTEIADLTVFLQSNESWKEEKILVVGEGSNILFLEDFEGLVIHPNIPGVYAINEDRQNIWMEVGAGEIWDEFVKYCVDAQLGGIENLSLIPGTVGAAPVQNIGAYGQEVSEVIEKVKGYDLEKNEAVEFSNQECRFSYRNSIFKQELKNRFVITSVVFKLDKFPEFRLDYSNLEAKVSEKGVISLENIKKAVDEIRSSKLPDVKELGSAGSFFKNPLVEMDKAEEIEKEFGEIPVYRAGDGKVKIAAGWLVEKAGWKGFRDGDVGVHEKQALVLVNYGKATGKQIYELSEKIKQSVLDKFGVELEREVNCI